MELFRKFVASPVSKKEKFSVMDSRIRTSTFAFVILFVGASLFCDVVAASDTTAVNYCFSYTADGLAASNNHSNHYAHLGLVQVGVTLNTSGLGWWQGGSFYANAFAAYGGTPSSDFIGDRQIVSNIEAGEYYGLYELSYQHRFGFGLMLAGGLLDLNSDFFVSDNASLFINSAFGIGSNLSLNHSPAIYPVTGLGLMGGFAFSPKFSVKAGVYDGVPEIATSGWHGFNMSLSSADGVLSIAEAQYTFLKDQNLLLQAKVGGCYQNSRLDGLGRQSLWSAYGTVDYSSNLSNAIPGWMEAFAQLGVSRPGHVELNGYIGVGATWVNPLGDNLDGAELGAAYAAAIPSMSGLLNERVVELSARVPVYRAFCLQCDYQYVNNPSFGTLDYSSAHVLIVRLQVEL